ncbi:2-polyprenyl-6-methoxyphenol hydroxylase-like FAD-dependent oxidoreductase [Hamadaea flava]|uniref:FAD-dependent oxidoreductase n=1 Tax=Hamadaea flava TaxID=1742688 RepID=A0ABV8M390_9ACTN|nr:FAD-dependent monooxygenase [Hamadaea flava]MCP2328532.1 2-polyprenyl-6-methoxyphenol hydroxylase-like FAD-dependent oxidoreductase [Hamadaea flava]
MTKPSTAAIIGGGVAGPVTAMALRQAGIEATVFEAYAHGAEGVGSFLTVAVNGQRALRELDLLDLVRKHGFDCPRFEFVSGKGKPLGGFPAAPTGPDGLTSRTVRRTDLYEALRDEALRRGVTVEYGKRLVDAERGGDGVTAVFADGTRFTADILVGADGLLSRTRELIDPAAPKPRYVPLLNTGGFTRAAVPGEPGTMVMYFGRDAFFCHMLAPDGVVWWFANIPQVRELSPAELAAITPQQWRRRLIDTFAVDATPARAVVEATEQIALPWNTYDFPSVPTWHDDRMVLVGDAAHAAAPTSGQGASLAIEDALVLAKALRDAPDAATAFSAYERERRGRVERIVAEAKKLSSDKMPGPVGRLIRDAVLPLVFAKRAKSGGDDWVLSHEIHWA